MMALQRSAALLALAAALGGCATAPATSVGGVSLAPMRTERIAVNYTMVHKSFDYYETQYRVLWLENSTANREFGGLWNPDPDLTRYTTDRLRAQAFKADSAYDLVDQALVTAADDAIIADAVANGVDENPSYVYRAVGPLKKLPLADHFLVYPNDPAFTAMAQALQARGVRYLVQLTAAFLRGNSPGYGMVFVSTEPDVRVIDLQAHQVVANRFVLEQDVFQLGGDLRKLEVDNLAKTKEGLLNATNKVDFAKLWGV